MWLIIYMSSRDENTRVIVVQVFYVGLSAKLLIIEGVESFYI